MNLKQEHVLALLKSFVDAELAKSAANDRFQLALAAINKTDIEGLFLVGEHVVRVNHFECGGPRIELVGGLKKIDDSASEIEITEPEEDNDDLIPW